MVSKQPKRHPNSQQTVEVKSFVLPGESNGVTVPSLWCRIRSLCFFPKSVLLADPVVADHFRCFALVIHLRSIAFASFHMRSPLPSTKSTNPLSTRLVLSSADEFLMSPYVRREITYDLYATANVQSTDHHSHCSQCALQNGLYRR